MTIEEIGIETTIRFEENLQNLTIEGVRIFARKKLSDERRKQRL